MTLKFDRLLSIGEFEVYCSRIVSSISCADSVASKAEFKMWRCLIGLVYVCSDPHMLRHGTDIQAVLNPARCKKYFVVLERFFLFWNRELTANYCFDLRWNPSSHYFFGEGLSAGIPTSGGERRSRGTGCSYGKSLKQGGGQGLSWRYLLGLCFLIAASPMLLFSALSGGTLVFGNKSRSPRVRWPRTMQKTPNTPNPILRSTATSVRSFAE